MNELPAFHVMFLHTVVAVQCNILVVLLYFGSFRFSARLGVLCQLQEGFDLMQKTKMVAMVEAVFV